MPGRAPEISAEATLRDALSILLSARADVARVMRDGIVVGVVRLDDIHAAAAEAEPSG